MKWSATLLFLSIFGLSYAQTPKNYTLEEFLKASDKELRAHKEELDKLIAQKKLNIPQSQAMLFYPDPIANKNELQGVLETIGQAKSKWPNLDPGITKALNDAMAVENKQNAQGNLVLYHSTLPRLYAQSYINTQLQKLALELKGKKIDTETLLMRDLNKPRSYQEEESKRQKFLKYGTPVHDSIDQQYLISATPAIMSNVSLLGESPLYYFLEKRNISLPRKFPLFIPKDNKLLDKTITAQSEELSETLREFNTNTDTSILLQFIVKDYNLGRKILYNSKPAGRKTDLWLHGWHVSDPVAILNIMRTDPAAFKDYLGSQQMRVVITGDKLLDLENPAMKEFDVKAYSGSDKSLKEFQQKVDASIQKIRADYFTQKQQLSWPKRIQYGARDLFYRRQSPWEQRQQYKSRLRSDIGSPFE